MGFNPPVPQQDSNWEIRVALLLSLLLQVLLIFLGPMRKRSASPISRFIIWSCYLLADWVADLGLGLILNNMGNIGGGGGNSTSSFGLKHDGDGGGTTSTTGSSNDAGSSSTPIIFAFWTPFLLLHLGGPDTITAYSLEDNELWLRHLIGLLFELFSACVIFFCSLNGNPLIHATVLVFVVGIIKYGERTYSLYSGSVDGFRNKILDPPEPGPNYAKLMAEFDSKKKAGLEVEIDIANEAKQETRRLVVDTAKSVEARAYEFFLVFCRLFVNVILSFKERRESQAFFLEREATTPKEAFDVIEVELNFIYDMVYTKAPLAHKKAGWVLRCVCSCCLISTLVIFFFLDKPGHQILRIDVGITYALLLGGLALDVVALLMIFFSNSTKVYLEERSPWLGWLAKLRKATKQWQTRRWSGKTSQLNLITHSLGKPAHAWCCLGLNKVADCLGLDGIVDDFIFIRRVWLTKRDKNKSCRWLRWVGRCIRERLIRLLVPKCCDKAGVLDKDDDTEDSHLLDFIFHGLKGSAQKLDKKHEIMEVCNRRGKGVIDRLEKHIKDGLKGDDDANHNKANKFDLIVDSVTTQEFDESLLLWHIATDLCRHKDREGPPAEDTPRLRAIGKTLSEYMLYLLIKQPDMLAATAGIGLLRYRDTCAEAQRFFDPTAAQNPDHNHHDVRSMLLNVNTTLTPAEVKGDRSKSVLFDAVILAKVLRELDEALMWEVITGVWGEMLAYAAGKCRGSMHVRQLSHGGELITLVGFLMAHMGLGDMYQIQEGDAKAKFIVRFQE